MKKILITGSKGRIGKILTKGLSGDYDLTFVDLPAVDIRDYASFKKIVGENDVIIHLAWNTQEENCFKEKIDPKVYEENTKMYENVYRVALNSDVPRVIMASSVHADNFRNPLKIPLTSHKKSYPLNPYGKHKVSMENKGREYSKKGLEVICVRFGAVGYGRPKDKEGKILWLTDSDCISLIKKIIEAKRIPNNFQIVYGISYNKERIHDISNPFGWKPKEGYR